MDETQRILIIVAAVAIAGYFMIRGRSLKSYVGDAEESRSVGDLRGSAIAFEQAAAKVRKSDPRKSAGFMNEAGSLWVEVMRPAAAVGAFRLALQDWKRGGGDDEFSAKLEEKIEAAEELLLDEGPDAMAVEAARRQQTMYFTIFRRVVLFGGVIGIYLGIQSIGLSYWWLLAPLAAHMAIHAYADRLK
jgi:hypothetical protein